MSITKNQESHYDVIVIGSGIGGLTAAAILAKLNKKRVLVLEQHFVAGGFTHTFSRKKVDWEVGLHYVGRMHKGQLQRVLFDYITDKKVIWQAIQSPFERFIMPNKTFFVSSSPEKYIADLIEEYPKNKSEIVKYFKDIDNAANWFSRYFLQGTLAQPLSFILKVINKVTGKIPLLTTKEYFDSYITNQELASLLASQWGNYGAPPQESAFTMHAAVVRHYLHGGFVPKGGSSEIATSIGQVLQEYGGEIKTGHTVSRIIVKDGHATGVEVMVKGKKETFLAPIIISNCGAEHTYNVLLDQQKTENLAHISKEMTKGSSSVTVYVGLKKSPKDLGVNGENIWISTSDSSYSITEYTEALIAGSPLRCYLSFPSLRSNSTTGHSAVIIATAAYAPFEKWEDQKWLKRDADYKDLKNELANSLVSLVEEHVPGFTDLIDFTEVATPLTVAHFSNRSKGSMYGFHHAPHYYSKKWFHAKTPIKGLYLSGTDVCSPGITGAMLGGVASAAQLNGFWGFFKIVITSRIFARKKV